MHHNGNITNVTCLLHCWLGTVRVDVGREAVRFSVGCWGLAFAACNPLVEMEEEVEREGVSRVTQ